MANWFYVRAGEQSGPHSEAQILQLLETGGMTPQTLVWTDSMPDWLPYAEVAHRFSAPATGSLPPTVTAAGTCPNCARPAAPEDLVQVGATQVCAHCKADYVQRIKEGVHLHDQDRIYAGFWIRVGAHFIDQIILTVVLIPLMILFGGSMAFMGRDRDPSLFTMCFMQILYMAVPMTYYIFFWGHPRFQATPGKMACRLRLITPDAERVTYLRALGRYFAHILSGMILCIGFIMCIWDDERRCLHDMICNTRVVRT